MRMPTAPTTPRMLANRVPLFPALESLGCTPQRSTSPVLKMNQKLRQPAVVLSSPRLSIKWQPPSVSEQQCVASSPIEPQKEVTVASPSPIEYEHAEREAISILMSMTKSFPKKMRLLNDFKGEDGNQLKNTKHSNEPTNLKGQTYCFDEESKFRNKSKVNRRIVLTRKMQQTTPLPPFKAILNHIHSDPP